MGEPSSALVEGVAGALGGVLGLATTYPLLAVSTRLQLQRRAPSAADAAAAAAPAAAASPEGALEKVRRACAQARLALFKTGRGSE
jgi:hypothetical protein